MTNNDILIRIRYAFHFKNAEMLEIFSLGKAGLKLAQVINLLKKEEEEGFYDCEDKILFYTSKNLSPLLFILYFLPKQL